TEFLAPQNVDFVCFNVYLHNEVPFRNYLGRLQMLADSRPLVLGEFGIDSIREGEARKCEILRWQIEESFRCELSWVLDCSFTDEWFKDGRLIEDWEMGLTKRERRPKDSFFTVKKMFEVAPCFTLKEYPKVSIVVASFNGERTLKACLDSLQK